MTVAAPPLENATIQEFFDNRGAKLGVDRDAGVIRGVKLLGLESKNGRTYPKQTVANALSLYEGAKVNVNHPTGSPTAPRDYRDRMGMFRAVRVAEGDKGMFGDFHYNPKHPLAEQLLWDAEHAPENVGFSHNVQAKVSRQSGKVVVEEITRVQSVDLVADPATTKGLYEAHHSEEEEGDMPATMESLQAEQPDLLQAIREGAVKRYVSSEAVKTAAAESVAAIKSLTEENDVFRAAAALIEQKATVDKELADAKLPDAVVTDVFRTSLCEAKDASTRKALIDDRLAIVKAAGNGKPLSREQNLSEDKGGDLPKVDSGKSFVSAIT